MNLHNQVALITGASRGIGRAILDALAQAGATVIGTATSDSGAEAISHYIAEKAIKAAVKNCWSMTTMPLKPSSKILPQNLLPSLSLSTMLASPMTTC